MKSRLTKFRKTAVAAFSVGTAPQQALNRISVCYCPHQLQMWVGRMLQSKGLMGSKKNTAMML